MTLDQFRFILQVKKEFEFTFEGIVYSITCEKDKNGKDYISFGKIYEGQRYDSYGELMNNAKIDNYFLKQVLEEL